MRNAIIAAVLGSAVLFGIVTANAEEESPLFNCYLSGNNECGATPHILGYLPS